MLAGATSVMADDYNYLNIVTSESATTSVSITNLKLTFSNGNVIVTNNEGTSTFALADLDYMVFAETAAGISNISAGNDSQTKVYTTNGYMVKKFDADTAVDLSELPKGVYILKSGNMTRKVVNK